MPYGAHVSVREDWQRIVEWCRPALPNIDAALRRPAGDAAVQSAMAATGVGWPEPLREWYSLCDGVDPASRVPLFAGFRPLSLAEIVATWQMQQRSWADLLARPQDSAIVRKRMALGGPAHDPRRDIAHLDSQPAATVAGMFLPSYIPFAAFDAWYLFVDCRTGPLSGCVTEYAREDSDTQGPRWATVAQMLREVADALEHQTPAAGRIPEVRNGTLSWEVVITAESEAALRAWRASQGRS